MQHAAFNEYAPLYDAHFTHSKTGMAQRNRVYSLLARELKKDCTVLELNCGTGQDAHWLARQGCTVFATDAAEGMVHTARTKNAAEKNVSVSMADLRMPEQLPQQQVDLVFSNFGGLNCLSPDELRQLAPALAKRLTPDGKAVLVVMGRGCWWERFYFLLKRDARRTRRNSKTAVKAIIEGREVNTWYYTPREFASFFQPHFRIKNAAAVGLFVPPSYLDPFFARKSFLFSILAALDRLLARGSWCANAADHFLITLEPSDV
ncbi:MAG: class I SAM-dependent methyltransferase [Bacteroidetes bacterium]|nr:class I SAM-dependent methyltransferase [Bacteroidota bacterium]